MGVVLYFFTVTATFVVFSANSVLAQLYLGIKSTSSLVTNGFRPEWPKTILADSCNQDVQRIMRTSGFTEAELAAAAWTRRHTSGRKNSRRSSSASLSSVSVSAHSRRRHQRRRRSCSIKERSRRPSFDRRPRSDSRSSTEEDFDSLGIPRDPRNPLHAAYELPRRSHKTREDHKRERRGKHLRDSYGRKHSRRACRSSSAHRSGIQKGKLRSDALEASANRQRKQSYRYNSRDSSERWTHDAFEMRSESPNRERTHGVMWDTRRGAWRSRAGGVYLPPSPTPSEELENPSNTNRSNEPSGPSRYKYPRNTQSRRYHFNDPLRERSRSPSYIPRERGSPVYE